MEAQKPHHYNAKTTLEPHMRVKTIFSKPDKRFVKNGSGNLLLINWFIEVLFPDRW